MYLSWKFISILKTVDIFFTLFKLFTVFEMTLYSIYLQYKIADNI